MTGKGNFTHKPAYRTKILLIGQAIWLAVVFALGFWWTKLVSNQAFKIAELEEKLGISQSVALGQSLKMQNMIYWEAITFFGLLLLLTAILVWLYGRDLKRTKSMQAFFASITHELRTPLTSIRLQGESISETVSDPRARSLAERLIQDTYRLEVQVERMLELARMEGGGALYLQPIALKNTLIQTLRNAHAIYGEEALRFDLDVSEELTILSDPTALQVILKNMIENAIRHSRQAGVEIKIVATRKAEEIYVSFQDNGEDFAGDLTKLGKIYEKGAYSQGAGIGLYLVKTLMGRMGGAVLFALDPAAKLRVELCFREALHDK